MANQQFKKNGPLILIFKKSDKFIFRFLRVDKNAN